MPKKITNYECNVCGDTFRIQTEAVTCERAHAAEIKEQNEQIKDNLDGVCIKDIIFTALEDEVCGYCDGGICHKCHIQDGEDLIEVFKQYPNTDLQKDIVELGERIKKEVKQ